MTRDSNTGLLKKSRNLIESPTHVPVELVRKIQAQLIYLGLESLYEDAPTERELGTLTLSLTATEFEELRFKLRQLRKSVHKDNSIARMKTAGEKVYQLNIQLFPVTLACAQAVEAHPTNKPMLEEPFHRNNGALTATISPSEGAPVAASTNNDKDPTKRVSSLAADAANNAADLF